MRALPKGIDIDGAHCFGAPRIAGRGITTGAIKSFFLGGESIQSIIADAYPVLTVEEVENALRFEFERHLHQERISAAAIECEQLWAEYDEEA